MGPPAVVLVEGQSDRAALEALARRPGRDLAAEGVSVLAIGGAQAAGRFLDRHGPRGSDVVLAGLCDAGEEAAVRGALERAGLGAPRGRAGMEALGFHVCERDLEDELVRAPGAPAVEAVLAEHGRLRSFGAYQKQVAHRGRTTEDQLRGFPHQLEGPARRAARRGARSRARAAAARGGAGARPSDPTRARRPLSAG